MITMAPFCALSFSFLDKSRVEACGCEPLSPWYNDPFPDIVRQVALLRRAGRSHGSALTTYFIFCREQEAHGSLVGGFGSSVAPLLPHDSEGPPGGSYSNSSRKTEGAKSLPIFLNCNITQQSKTLKLKLKRGVGMKLTRSTHSSRIPQS